MNILTEWAEKARVGGKVIINGVEYIIEEIVAYHRGTDKWVNIVTHDADGHELAVEAVEGEDELTLWQEGAPKFKDLRQNGQDTLRYRRENYSLTEQEVALAIDETANGAERCTVRYWVYRAESGRQLAVENWENQLYCYFAEPTAPQVSF